jgi:GGDEF domain-containing protein
MLALAFTETALNEAALRHVVAALEAAQACGDVTAEFWALRRSSMVHAAMGDTQRGLELGRRALDLARTVDDSEAGFAALNNLGDTCQVVAREQRTPGLDADAGLHEARDYMLEAVELPTRMVMRMETVARNNMVGITTDVGEYADAREQGKLAKLIAKTNGYRNLEVTIDVQMADVVKAGGGLTLATSMMDAQLAHFEANTDPLIRLANRRALDGNLPSLMSRAADDEQPLCVAMVDFDHFKVVNDVHGHATGDLVLLAMAEILRAATRWARLRPNSWSRRGPTACPGSACREASARPGSTECHATSVQHQLSKMCSGRAVEGQGIHRRAYTEGHAQKRTGRHSGNQSSASRAR